MKKSIYNIARLFNLVKTKNIRFSLWYQMLFLVLFLFMNSYLGRAQCTTYTNAVPGLILTPCTGTSTRSGVAYNPIFNLYYSVNAGNKDFTIQTYNSAGALLDTRPQGLDYRGLWWNPRKNLLEGNGYGSLGVAVHGLNATNGYPDGAVRIVFPANQPTTDACGTYDYDDNDIIYYSYYTGNIYVYSHRTNILKTIRTLNGIPVPIDNISSFSVIYTGCPGKEIGLWDYVNRRVYLFDKVTGNFAASIQLPLSAPKISGWAMAYSNNLFWLFNGKDKWLSYQLFAPATSITLNASNENNAVALHWQTNNEFKSKNFIVEKSKDGINFKEITNVKAILGSKNLETYKATDNIFEGKYYYRVKQTDDYGNVSYSSVATLNTSKALSISPNPARASVNMKMQSQVNTKGQAQVSDITGRIVMSKTVVLTAGENNIYLDVSTLKAGVYVIKITRNNSVETIKFVKE